MVDFAEIAALVSDVVEEENLGAEVVLTRVTPGEYDPATGTTGAPTTTTQTVFAPVSDYGGLGLITGLVQMGDKKVEIPADQLTDEPKPTDQMTINGVAHTILGVPETVEAGGVVILYVLRCRR